MRYILSKRRRLWIILIFLLLAVSVSVLIISWPRLLNDFKNYARKEIAKNFDVEADVGEVRGGFIEPLSFENLCVTKKKDERNFISFKSKTSLTDYRVWDLFLAQIYGYREFALLFSGGELYVNSENAVLFGIEGKVQIDENQTIQVNLIANHGNDKVLLTGTIEKEQKSPDFDLKITCIKQPAKLDIFLKGSLEKLDANGAVFLPEGKKIDFSAGLGVAEKEIKIEDGEIGGYYAVEGVYKTEERNFGGKLSYLENRENYLAVDFSLPSLPSAAENLEAAENIKRPSKPFLAKLQFNHFNLFGRDVMSLVEMRGALDDSGGETEDKSFGAVKKVSFELVTCGTVIDRRPANELKISCHYEDGILDIGSIHLGEEHFTYGTVDFRRQPPELKLTWQVMDMDLTNLLVLSDDKSAASRLGGKLDGKIQVEGSVFNPFIKLAFTSKEGKFLSMDFASANVNLEGNYPVLTFHDSRIYREEGGFFVIDGKIDLRDMHTLGLFDNVKILTDEKTIVVDGWDISRGAEQSELNLKKAVSDDLKVGFKAFINNQTPAVSDEANSLELEYKLQENRALLMRFEKEGEFLGVKQGAKF